jgi:sulfoxide reductase heme-binding subunit YedZ
MTNDPTIWLVARASGLVAYGLMTASVLAGLMLKTRPFGRLVRAVTAMEIHRSLSFLGLAAIGAHGVALVLDRSVNIRIADLLIPGTSPYRPVWTALGVVAAELTALIIVSFPLRRRLGMRAWRRLHWATYGVFALATVHGIATGTDTSQPWVRTMYIGAIAAVAAATTWRALTTSPAPRPVATPARADGARPPVPVPESTRA